jgi:spoIIIJ-associated protein
MENVMEKSIDVQGRNEDEAIELALEQLGLSRDDVSVEIIEQAKTGFLGLKSSPAIVRVTYEDMEAPETVSSVSSVSSMSSGGFGGHSGITDFLGGLLARMDIEAKIEITENAESVDVNLIGSDPGVLIGRRGETLDAMQHLTNYVVNRGSSNRLRINFDTEGYRKRRSESLENLARRTADKVIRYRKNLTLDPMNAYERHIVHAALQDKGQVSTFSIGSEPNRRVVVAYGQKGQKSDRSDFRSRPPRSNFGRSDSERLDTQDKAEPQSSSSESPAYKEWS